MDQYFFDQYFLNFENGPIFLDQYWDIGQKLLAQKEQKISF